MEPNQPISIIPEVEPSPISFESTSVSPTQPIVVSPSPEPILTQNIPEVEPNLEPQITVSDIQSPFLSQAIYPPPPTPSESNNIIDRPNKSFLTTVFLSFFGFIGLDRFYLGKFFTGTLKLLSLGGLGIWLLYDEILLLVGITKDSHGNPLSINNKKNQAIIIGILLFVVQWSLIGISIPKDISLVKKISIFQSSKVKMNNYLSANPLSIIGNTIPLDVGILTTDGEHGLRANFISDCTQLSKDNQVVASLPKMPDLTANNDLLTFMNGVSDIIKICKVGIPSTALEINSYNVYINQINTASGNLNKRLDSIIGVSSSVTTI